MTQLEKDLALIGRWLDRSGSRTIKWRRCGDGSHQLNLLCEHGELGYVSSHGQQPACAIHRAAIKVAAKHAEIRDNAAAIIGDWSEGER
jgi:hypothetical protein